MLSPSETSHAVHLLLQCMLPLCSGRPLHVTGEVSIPSVLCVVCMCAVVLTGTVVAGGS